MISFFTCFLEEMAVLYWCEKDLSVMIYTIEAGKRKNVNVERHEYIYDGIFLTCSAC